MKDKVEQQKKEPVKTAKRYLEYAKQMKKLKK